MTDDLTTPDIDDASATLEPVSLDQDGFDLDDWINGGKIAEQSLAIYAKPGHLAKINDLERQHARAEAVAQAETSLAGDSGELERIVAELEQTYEEFLASEVTWYVRALDDDDYAEIEAELTADGFPKPEKPAEPKPLPPVGKRTPTAVTKHEAAVAEHKAKLEEFEAAARVYATERNCRVIARATTRVRRADGEEASGVTYDQIKRMRKQFGQRQILSIMHAIQIASFEEPDVPAPFWRESSSDDQT